MSIVLGLIAVGNEVLGEYPTDKEKLVDVISQKVLPRLEKSDHKRTLTQNEYDCKSLN